MSKVALYVPLEAKPGKEKEVAEFLKSALPLVDAEPGTVTWFAIRDFRQLENILLRESSKLLKIRLGARP